ncbi:MAG: hypothetical protein MI892_00925, partial [Desulfobacterales bacterium]|nr:hypothetical protein [Desulfobacterales bacterium]
LKHIRLDKPRYYGEDLASLFFASDRKGKLMELIPHELAIADPTNPSRHGYQLQPYHGYHIQPLTTRPYTDTSIVQWRRVSGQRFPWMESKDKFLTVASVPNLIATPAYRQGPTIIYVAETDQVYLIRNHCKEIKFLPPNLTTDPSWIQVNTRFTSQPDIE